jgi:hypothetical protein
MQTKDGNSGLARQITIDGVLFYHMPINVAIKYADKITSGFFVPLSEAKRVRIHPEDDDIKTKMEGYKEKGLESILLAEADYYEFVKKIKHGLIGHFLNDHDDPRQLDIEQMLALVKRVTIYIGLAPTNVELAEEVVRSVFSKIKTVSIITEPLREFQRNNQNEFLKSLMVCYTSIGLIDAINWTSPGIKEKIAHVCLFSDLTLSAEDYTEMLLADNDHTKFSKKILNHPIDAANLVGRTRNAVSNEAITAIRQHHELPDGTGYPKKIKGLTINNLSAVQIVARMFINSLVETNFAYDDRQAFIRDLLRNFNYPNFAGPCRALYQIMGLEPEEFESDY